MPSYVRAATISGYHATTMHAVSCVRSRVLIARPWVFLRVSSIRVSHVRACVDYSQDCGFDHAMPPRTRGGFTLHCTHIRPVPAACCI